MSSNADNTSDKQKKEIINTLDEKLVENIPSPQLPVNNLQHSYQNPYTTTGMPSTPLYGLNQGFEFPDGTQPVPLASGVISGLLGEGGMARVYRIWNEKLEVYRAVKVFLPNGRPELLKRFETEIKISAKLHHPNIIEIHSVGDWNGLPYIEMELVEGISLEDLINQKTIIPVNVAVAIGIQIADALFYAHNQKFLLYGKTYNGIIHRDLKPANIMISKSGIIKLLDFGIARPAEVGLHTVAGNVVGTLPYLSPEQLDDKDIDKRSDIYSLGTILYESLTGEKTFPQTSVTALMKMKSTGEYRKFDTFSCNVPIQLTRIVEKCLCEDKEKRFSSSAELEKSLFPLLKRAEAESPILIIERFLQSGNDTIVLSEGKKSGKNRLLLLCSTVFSILAAALLLYFIVNQKKSDIEAVIKEPKIMDDKIVLKSDSLSYRADSVNLEKVSEKKEVSGSKDSVLTKSEHITIIDTPKTKIINPVNTNVVSNNKPQKNSPIEQLKIKYKQDDLVKISDAACNASNFNDAIVALEKLPFNHPDRLTGLVFLSLAYLEINRVEKAQQIAETINSQDAYFSIILGRIALAQKKDKQALNTFQLALTRSSNIRSVQYVRSEALYYTALIYDSWFKAESTPENRQLAIVGWNNLKRIHANHPDNARFKLANKKLSEF